MFWFWNNSGRQSSIRANKSRADCLLSVGALLISLSLILLALTGANGSYVQAQVGTATAPAHTPTVPSGERPNLHIYLRDEGGQPVTRVAVKLYSFDYSNGKYELLERDKGTTDNQFGKVAFDATKVLPGLYYLEMKETSGAGAGAVVLPTDPDGAPIGTGGGRPPAEVRNMTTINLFEGSVIYVFHFELRPLINLPVNVGGVLPVPVRAVYVPSSRRYIYYPEAGSNLSKVSTVTPGPSPTPAPPTPTFTPFATVATRSNTTINATATRNAQSQTATATRNVSGSGTGGAGAGAGVGVAATPTPTSECRGCIPPNSTAGARATIEAATIAAGLTVGIYNVPAGGEGRSGSGGSSSNSANATPNPNSNSNLPPTVLQTGVATEPQVMTISSTGTGTTAPATVTVQLGVSSNPTSTSTNANNGSNGQGQGQGLSIVGQGQGQSVTTTTSGAQPQPGTPSGSGGGSAISNLLPGSGVVPTLTPNGAGATGNVGNGSSVASNPASPLGSTTAPSKEDNNSPLLLLIGVSLLLILIGGVIALKVFGRSLPFGKRKEHEYEQEGNQAGEDAR
jgi:hypothetical protein